MQVYAHKLGIIWGMEKLPLISEYFTVAVVNENKLIPIYFIKTPSYMHELNSQSI